MMAKLNGAQTLIACLKQLEIKNAYGIIGTSVVPVITEFGKTGSGIRYISTRHEQVAASMADTEGRITGRPGVAFTHSGPGTLNAAISAAVAYKDCSPMILISGAVEKRLMGCDGFVETEHTKVFAPLCKAALRAENVADIPGMMAKAYEISMTEAKGPVLVEIPESLWYREEEVSLDVCKTSSPLLPSAKAEDVKQLKELLSASKKPVILAGGGLNSKKGSETLTAFVDKFKIPVITSGNGRGALSETHELCLGRAGFGGGNPSADFALENADFILAAGSIVSDQVTYHHSVPIKAKAAIINADSHAKDIKSSVEIAQFVLADAKETLSKLSESLGSADALLEEWKPWRDQIARKKQEWNQELTMAAQMPKTPPVPSKVLAALAAKISDKAVITAGQGYHLMYASNYLRAREPKTFFTSNNYGAMGYGFPAALAAQLLHPDRQVITVLGDGDFLMTLQDMETAVRENLPVKIVVINDDAYRVLLLTQRIALFSEPFGSEHKNPDFVKLAESFGAKGFRVEKEDEIEAKIKEFLETPGVALLEIPADKADMTPVNLQAVMRMNEAKRKLA